MPLILSAWVRKGGYHCRVGEGGGRGLDFGVDLAVFVYRRL